jgi:hypothetical protein
LRLLGRRKKGIASALFVAALILAALFAQISLNQATSPGPQLHRRTSSTSSATTTTSSGTHLFSKVWTVPLSQYDQSDQFANSLTQLSNGGIVAGGPPDFPKA